MDFINFINPSFWIKIITLIVIGFYAVFTFIVFTQTKVMARILYLKRASFILTTIARIHIALAISLFLLAIVIL